MTAARVLAAAGVVTVLLAGCEQVDSVGLEVKFADQALADDVDLVELTLLRTCPDAATWTTAPTDFVERIALRKGAMTNASFRTKKPGNYALLARGIAGDCAVVGVGCAPVRFAADVRVASVLLDNIEPVNCAEYETCDDTSLTCTCSGATTHVCGAACVSNTAVTSCGDRCDPCDVPDHGTATCDDEVCGFTCDYGYEICDDHCCATVVIETFAEPGETLSSGAIALDSDGVPHVLFGGGLDNPGTFYATRVGDGWHTETVGDVGSTRFGITRMVFDDSGHPHVAFTVSTDQSNTLKYATKTDDEWALRTFLDSSGALIHTLQTFGDEAWIAAYDNSIVRAGKAPTTGAWTPTEVSVTGDSVGSRFTAKDKLELLTVVPVPEDDLRPITHYVTTDGTNTVSDEVLPWTAMPLYAGPVEILRVGAEIVFPLPAIEGVGVSLVRGTPGNFSHDEGVGEPALLPVVAVSPDGKYVWLAYTSCRRAVVDPDAGPPIYDATGCELTDQSVQHMKAYVKRFDQDSDWVAVDIDPEHYLGAYVSIAVAADGAAHMLYPFVTAQGSDDSEIGLRYIYAPVPDELR